MTDLPRFEDDPEPGEAPPAFDMGPEWAEMQELSEEMRAARSQASIHALAYAVLLALDEDRRNDVWETFRPAMSEPYDEAVKALRNLAQRDPRHAAQLVGWLNRGLDAGRDAAQRLAAAWNDATPGIRGAFLKRIRGR